MDNFDKEVFSKILSDIYEKYPNQRKFAKEANVNRTYISKYINKKIDVPPSVKILRKLSKASKGMTTYQKLMRVCGYLQDDEIIIKQNKNILEQILELANGLNIQEANYLIKILKNSKILINKEG